MARTGERMNLENCKELMKKYCDFLVEPDIEHAHFKFADILEAYGMISFLEDSYILIDKDIGLKIKDIGSGDVSPKFEHPLHLIKVFDGELREFIPVNISYTRFFNMLSELLEKEFYLLILDDKSKLEKALSDTEDKAYVVIHPSSMGSEDFFEYMGGLHLKKRGYIVTRWNPKRGSDFFAYKIPEYMRILRKFGIVKAGAFLSELELFPMIRYKTTSQAFFNEEDDNKYDIIVCEAESGYNLALHSNTGIGQKIGWMDAYHEVYGVGPTTYVPTPESIYSYFGKRSGAIVFTHTLEKVEIKPSEWGFTNENYTIEVMKAVIRSIFLHKLLLDYKDTKLTLREYVRLLKELTLQDILLKLETSL